MLPALGDDGADPPSEVIVDLAGWAVADPFPESEYLDNLAARRVKNSKPNFQSKAIRI
jgi:hypothetical protein